MLQYLLKRHIVNSLADMYHCHGNGGHSQEVLLNVVFSYLSYYYNVYFKTYLRICT